MEINQLIKMGEAAAKACCSTSDYGEYYFGQAYEEWLTLCYMNFISLNMRHNIF